MDRKKVIYIGLLFIITVIVSITYFSYAFFTHKDEQHGKLNIITGTLDYKISSSLLDNTKSITLASYEKARLNIKIESLNSINSKYELYYTTTNNNIEIGYTSTNQQASGTINAKATKIVTVIIKNKTNSSATITFGVQGGFTGNTLTLLTGKNALTQYQDSYCEVATNTVYNFDYNGTDGTDGSEQEFNVPCSGNYKVELWGAQGGNYILGTGAQGGRGGYSTGNINLLEDNKLYVYIGGQGNSPVVGDNAAAGGYNGGGIGSNVQSWSEYQWTVGGAGGGGASHITIDTNFGVLSNYADNKEKILIVAAGGGGAGANSGQNANQYNPGGSGGGFIGNDGTNKLLNGYSAIYIGLGATQDEAGCSQSRQYACGNFGIGGSNNRITAAAQAAGGGGGYYGGGAGANYGSSGGGGSGYIANSKLTAKSMYCYDCQEDGNTNTYTVSTHGTTTHSSERDTTNCPNGYSSNPIGKCAKSGNGYARITYLSESTEEEKTSMKYVVTFNANGGSGTMTSQVFNYNDEASLHKNTFTRTGYKFVGWSTNANSTYANLITSASPSATVTSVSANKWYIDYTAHDVDTYIVFATATGNEVVAGEYYTLLFNVSDLTANNTSVFGFPDSSSNRITLKNGINKIRFNSWYSVSFNRYVFDDATRDTTQKFYVSDFRLYRNLGNDYYDEEKVSKLTNNDNITLYAIWEAN